MSSFGDSPIRAVGFIGLGAMGKPMVKHLANKLPPETFIYVFDVVQLVVDELCADFPNKVVKGLNAKVVAEMTVRIILKSLRQIEIVTDPIIPRIS